MAVDGLADLRRKLTQAIPREVLGAAKDAIAEEADALVAAIRAVVPRDQGKLAASIGWTFGDAPEGSITIGTVGGNEYGTIRATIYAGDATTLVYNSRGIAFQNALLQEFGTKGGVPASGFFFGTYRKKRRGARTRITRKIGAAIKKAYANG